MDNKRIIEGADPQNLLKNKEFIEKLLNNNKIMRARFLSLHNPLLKFMTENTSFGKLIEELKDPRTKDNSVKVATTIKNAHKTATTKTPKVNRIFPLL